MVHRYEAWVEGLNGDWNISRQRFFGVPFPVWYPVGGGRQVDYEHPIVPPTRTACPSTPPTTSPTGTRQTSAAYRAGSSATPTSWTPGPRRRSPRRSPGDWVDDPDLFGRVFPMDLRPQCHEIIRTWLFSTVVRAELEHGELPWSDVGHLGLGARPRPQEDVEVQGQRGHAGGAARGSIGTDAVRYWAACGRPGVDTAFDEAQMKVGRRLAMKVLNASRFALGRLDGAAVPEGDAVTVPLDLAMLSGLAAVVSEATHAYESYDYARALERTEGFFWPFCDDYVELVKARAYQDPTEPEAASARAALGLSLSVLLRLFAPVLPFVTEEVWSWWHRGSVHRSPWPTVAEFPAAAVAEGTDVLDMASWVLGAVRRAKTEAHRSMRVPVARLVVTDSSERLELLSRAEADVREAGGVLELVTAMGEPEVHVVLGEPAAS